VDIEDGIHSPIISHFLPGKINATYSAPAMDDNIVAAALISLNIHDHQH